jgi:hypothetical protein
MGQSDNNDVTPFRKFVRQMLSVIDVAGLYLLVNVYKIFFNVATAEIFNGQYSRDIFVRVQMILGVFMLFKLSASILSGIVDPDKFTDQKQGFGNIIKRVITSLVLLTLVVPLNIPNLSAADSGTYNAELYNNGILFGTMYSLQKRVLTGDVIGKLLIGGDDVNYFSDNADLSDNKDSDISKAANRFGTSVLRAFIRINLVPASELTAVDTGKSYESNAENIMCSTENGASYAADDGANDQQTVTDAIHNFSSDSLTYVDLIYEATNATCNVKGNTLWVTKAISKFSGDGGERWAFNYIPILPFLAAIILSVILILSTIDVAVRAIKLAVLRIIAPIPIISYMDPKSSGDGGMFSSWTKSVLTTYLDIFIRVGLLYGALYFINEFIVNGIVINQSTGIVGAISFILIAFGMIDFARTGPKFIKESLGIKGGLSWAGLKGTASFIGSKMGGASWTDALKSGIDTSTKEFNGGKDIEPSTFSAARDANIKKIREKNSQSLTDEAHKRQIDLDPEIDGQPATKLGKVKKFLARVDNPMTKDAKDATDLKNMIDKNKSRYAAQANNYSPAEGRGITVRHGMTPKKTETPAAEDNKKNIDKLQANLNPKNDSNNQPITNNITNNNINNNINNNTSNATNNATNNSNTNNSLPTIDNSTTTKYNAQATDFMKDSWQNKANNEGSNNPKQ